MKKTLISMTFIALMSSNAQANEQTSEEDTRELVGMGSGVVIGAAIAGPVGAVVGGIFGLMVGDEMNDDKRLADANQQIDKREKQLVAMHTELESVKQQAHLQLV